MTQKSIVLSFLERRTGRMNGLVSGSFAGERAALAALFLALVPVCACRSDAGSQAPHDAATPAQASSTPSKAPETTAAVENSAASKAHDALVNHVEKSQASATHADKSAPADEPAAGAQWSQAQLEAVAAQIQSDVEELRGAKFDHPIAVKLTDKKGFIDYALTREKETESDEKFARDETVAKMLGFIPPEMNLKQTMLDLLEGQVGGFYDPSTKTFYLMDTFTGGVAKIIMAHELTHALDDQHYDIDGTLKKLGDDTDASLAFQAVVEGSGTNLMNQWFKTHMSEVSADDLERAQGMSGDSLENTPPYLWLPLLAVYLRGEGFLVHTGGINMLAKAADVKDVDRAFKSPPKSSEQILHPDKYWKDSKHDDPLKVTIDTSRLPKGWSVAGEDTLGELYLGLLTTPREDRKGLSANPMAVLGVKYTNKASEGWGGDRLVLLKSGDQRFLELVTAWDTQKDADDFCAVINDDAHPVFIDAKDHEMNAPDSKKSKPIGTPGGTLVSCSVQMTTSNSNPSSSTAASDGPWVVVIKMVSGFDPAATDWSVFDDLPWTVEPKTSKGTQAK